MRKPTLLLALGLFGCVTLAVVAQPPPAAEHPGVDAKNRLKDLQAKFQPWEPAQDVLQSLAVLEELVGGIRSTQQQLLRLAGHRDPQVRRQALIVLAEVSRGMDNEREMVKELGKIAGTASVPDYIVGAYLGLARMGHVARPMLPTAREGRKHKDPEVRRAAYHFITSQFRLDQEGLLPDVIAALDDSDLGPLEKNPGINSVSWLAFSNLRHFAKTTGKAAAPKLLEIIHAKKGGSDYQLSAIHALAAVAPEEKLPLETARQWMKSPDWDTVMKGVHLIRTQGSHAKPAIPDLVALLHMKPLADATLEQSVKMAALEALGVMGSEAREAIPAMRALLAIDDATLRFHVTTALKRIEGNK